MNQPAGEARVNLKCHSPLDHDHHLQTAGKEEAGIGIKFARKEASKQWPSRKPLQPTL